MDSVIVKKSYTLTDEQKEIVNKRVQEIRKKHAVYESIECVTTFDAGVYFDCENTEDSCKDQ